MASSVTPADAAKGTQAVYGDTKTQAASVFAKIQKALQGQGLDMKDVVKMTCFLGLTRRPASWILRGCSRST